MQSLLGDEGPKPAAPPAGAPAGTRNALPIVLAVAGIGLALVLTWLMYAANRKIDALQARVTQMAAAGEVRAKEADLALAEVRGQTRTIAERVGVTEAELEKTAAAARELREAQVRGQKDLQGLGGEVVKVKEDVAANKAAIDEASAKLSRAIGDLGEQSGLIARNADELAALKRAGMREYVEFDLKKAKTPTPVGPVAIRLTDADVKRHKFNMLLVVDDLQIEKKDKTLLEPVQFYRKGSRQLQEIVVYTVAKDRIVGYLSMPKAGESTP
jgi:tape measure domain-containing protein